MLMVKSVSKCWPNFEFKGLFKVSGGNVGNFSKEYIERLGRVLFCLLSAGE